jgi:hypothetical protein
MMIVLLLRAMNEMRKRRKKKKMMMMMTRRIRIAIAIAPQRTHRLTHSSSHPPPHRHAASS